MPKVGILGLREILNCNGRTCLQNLLRRFYELCSCVCQYLLDVGTALYVVYIKHVTRASFVLVSQDWLVDFKDVKEPPVATLIDPTTSHNCNIFLYEIPLFYLSY